ncbi:hypothetical protein FA95DRAFT_1610736 [Auriscalpium vulgare]|uniref:Uncharacterized protein n=1 Tax=Auriscalpium vulgare TaxID=40419 RepID=A0ACB8RCU2_9AGAM|nr:hypothetical protein FA95DRAFT_1610736 [Auriscalpium vulgare]
MPTTFLEIDIAIIELIYMSSQHATIDYPSLRACALVCRAWRPIAQRLLFRRAPHPQLHPSNIFIDAGRLLLRTLRTSPHLIPHIRSIHIPLGSDIRTRVHFNEVECLALLELCAHVELISLQFLGLCNELASMLRAITINPAFLRVHADGSVVDQVINIWPGLRGLVVDAFKRQNFSLHIPRSVQSLHMNFATKGDGILQDSLPGLRELDVQYLRWSSIEYRQLCTSGVFGQIHRLHLERTRFPPQEILRQLVQLASFVFDCLPSAIEDGIELPPTLCHVGYHGPAFPQSETDWERFGQLCMALRALGSLNHVTATRMAPQDELAALDNVCRDRGLEFVVYMTPEIYHRPINVDWI